jgi:hypothetical protein
MNLVDVLSIDPGSRNFAMCLVRYTDPTGAPPESTEELLERCTLVNWIHHDFGTPYIPLVTERFAVLMRTPLLAWARLALADGSNALHTVIEQQGDPSSPMVKLCHALHGYFLASAPRGKHVLHFPAARKFNGSFVNICPSSEPRQSTVQMDPERERDPVKRAAIVLAGRMLSHMNVVDDVTKSAVRSQQHLADALCQAVAYLHAAYGSPPNRVTDVDMPQIATLLTASRHGRKRANRTTTLYKPPRKTTRRRKQEG